MFLPRVYDDTIHLLEVDIPIRVFNVDMGLKDKWAKNSTNHIIFGNLIKILDRSSQVLVYINQGQRTPYG